MSEQIDIDININMNNVDEVDELTTRLQAATDEVDNLTEELANIEMGTSDADFDEISSALEDAEAEAEELQNKLDEIGSTTVEPEVDVKDNVDEVNEKLQETETTASSLTTALGGMAGVIGVDQMISTADRINTSWNQLNLTFGDTGVSLDELKLKTSQAADATGLSGGQIRGYFNSMGIAGIQNTDLLSNSFQSLAGRSYQTGQSIEAMESKVQKMVMTGNAGTKMLTGLGITTEQLGAAMGVSAEEAQEAFAALDPEGRLEVLTKAMGDGTQANEMYKNSYAGLKQQAETAMAGLMGAVGQGVLPVITPLIQSATGVVKGLTGGFQSLPGPVQGAVGALGGLLAVGATAIGTLGLLGQVGHGVVDGLKSMKSGYDTVKDAMGTARAMMDALRNSESITEGVRAALAIATGAEATAEGGAAAAKSAAIGPTTGLAIAENSLLLPILLLVGAIVAVIAVLWYLYNTNEDVRNAVNWLAEAFQQVAQIMYTAIVGAVNWVIGALQNLWNYIMTLGGLLPEGVNITGNQIIDSILAVMMFISTLPIQLGMIFINIIAESLGFGSNFAQNMIQAGARALGGMVNTLIALPGRINAIFMQVISFVISWATNFIQKGVQAAQNFVNGVKNALSGIGSAISSALSGVFNFITAPFKQAYDWINNNVIQPLKNAWDWLSSGFQGFQGYEGYSGIEDTLNETISNINNSSKNSNKTVVNNNFNGLIEESAAEYIVNTVNDRLRREKLLRGG